MQRIACDHALSLYQKSQKNQNINVSISSNFALRLRRFGSAHDPVKTRLSESEAEAEG